MFSAPPLIYISNREISENTKDPLLDIDALMTEENWDIIYRTTNSSVYKKHNTDYDFIDIKHYIRKDNTHQFTYTIPLVSNKYAFSQTITGNINMFNYMSDFINHYNQQHYNIQHNVKEMHKL